MVQSKQTTTGEPSIDGVTHGIDDSLASVAGYIAASDTFSSLKPELITIIKEQGRANAYGEFRRIERLTHQRWLGMEIARKRSESVISDFESVRKVHSGSSSNAKSITSEESHRHASISNCNEEKGSDNDLERAQLKREVGAWWGRKCPE
jgi:hypothetical protein